VIVGRDEDQSEDLLAVIKTKLLSSSHAISMLLAKRERIPGVRLAESEDLPRMLYFCTMALQEVRVRTPVIADLQARDGMQYAQESRLAALLGTFSRQTATQCDSSDFSGSHSNDFQKRQKAGRALALKVVHRWTRRISSVEKTSCSICRRMSHIH